MKKLLTLAVIFLLLPSVFAVYGGGNIVSGGSPGGGGGGGGSGSTTQTSTPTGAATTTTSTPAIGIPSGSPACPTGTSYCGGLCCGSTEVCQNSRCIPKSALESSTAPAQFSEPAPYQTRQPLPTGYVPARFEKKTSSVSKVLTLLALAIVGTAAYFMFFRKKRKRPF